MLIFLATLALARPLVMAHYMPWFESKPVSGKWGWHWTMNHFDPDKGQVASKFHPLIGLYDSSDPAALECQCLQMKLSGIDGVLIDWYGTRDLWDYRQNHKNTERMVQAATKVGLKFGIVFEDSTAPNLIKQGKMKPGEALGYGRECLKFLDDHWFGLPNYVKVGGKPAFLVFGGALFYSGPQWESIFAGLHHPPACFTEMSRKPPAVGGFAWPTPQVGDTKSWTVLDDFYGRAKQWPASIGVAYPRFDDIYSQAGVGPGYGLIADGNGATYQRTLEMAFRTLASLVQIATWNDWGEGTQIEPSTEVGYRDLEATQKQRRRLDSGFSFTPSDLRLPVKLYQLRKRYAGVAATQQKLDRADHLIVGGKLPAASKLLSSLK